jgi:hypothetical protein
VKTFAGFILMMTWFFFTALVVTGCTAALGMPKESYSLAYIMWILIGGYGGGAIACTDWFKKWWEAM